MRCNGGDYDNTVKEILNIFIGKSMVNILQWSKGRKLHFC
jgi:hypothetical protein